MEIKIIIIETLITRKLIIRINRELNKRNNIFFKISMLLKQKKSLRA